MFPFYPMYLLVVYGDQCGSHPPPDLHPPAAHPPLDPRAPRRRRMRRHRRRRRAPAALWRPGTGDSQHRKWGDSAKKWIYPAKGWFLHIFTSWKMDENGVKGAKSVDLPSKRWEDTVTMKKNGIQAANAGSLGKNWDWTNRRVFSFVSGSLNPTWLSWSTYLH